MKKINQIFLLAFLLFPLNTLYPQYNFHFGATAGYTAKSLGVYSSEGANLGINFSYDLLPTIEVTARAAYNSINPVNYNYHLINNNSTPLPGKTDPEFYQSAIGFRLIKPDPKILPYLELEIGVNFQQQYSSTGLYLTPNSLDNYVIINQPETTSKTITKKFFALGFGFIVPLNSQVDFTLQGRYEQIFGNDESYFPVATGFRFGL